MTCGGSRGVRRRSEDIVRIRTLEFGEGCNVLRLHTRDIARGSGKLSDKGIAIDLVPNKGRLF